MDKLTLKAFELAGFTNPQTLLEIISSTPNPRVAAEMLLGIFEPVTPESLGVYCKSSWNSNESIYRINLIDELKDQVYLDKYSYNTVKVWYKSEEDYKNGVYEFDKPSNYYTTKYIRTNGYSVEEKVVISFNNEFLENYVPIGADYDHSLKLFVEWVQECQNYPDVKLDLVMSV